MVARTVQMCGRRSSVFGSKRAVSLVIMKLIAADNTVVHY